MDDVLGFYAKWGGIPRYVLELTKPTVQAELVQAIASADLEIIIRYAGEADAPNDTTHKLLHMIVEDNYTKFHMQMASPYVAQAVTGVFCMNLKTMFFFNNNL